MGYLHCTVQVSGGIKPKHLPILTLFRLGHTQICTVSNIYTHTQTSLKKSALLQNCNKFTIGNKANPIRSLLTQMQQTTCSHFNLKNKKKESKAILKLYVLRALQLASIFHLQNTFVKKKAKRKKKVLISSCSLFLRFLR